MLRGPLHRLWDKGEECRDGAGRAYIPQTPTACQLLYALACTQSKSGHLEPPLGTPQTLNILAPDLWNLRLQPSDC